MSSKILCFATAGSGSFDEKRIKHLLGDLAPEVFDFQYKNKRDTFFKLLGRLKNHRYDVVVMEGTGIAGGLALILSKLLFKQKYVVSSGDAVAPFLSAKFPFLSFLFSCYEKSLMKNSAGFIGWTPYLVGRSLTFGAKKAVTAAGWSQLKEADQGEILKIKKQYQLEGKIVVGIVGSLNWNARYQYCYGAELVQVAKLIKRDDLVFLIVGGGNGLTELEKQIKTNQLKNVVLVGKVGFDQVANYYAAMDIVGLPQSTDQVGSFRYTIKLSEYISQRVPFFVNQIPMAYDLDQDCFWRIKGDSPWDFKFIKNLSEVLESVTKEKIQGKKSQMKDLDIFNLKQQQQRVTQFIQELL